MVFIQVLWVLIFLDRKPQSTHYAWIYGNFDQSTWTPFVQEDEGKQTEGKKRNELSRTNKGRHQLITSVKLPEKLIIRG